MLAVCTRIHNQRSVFSRSTTTYIYYTIIPHINISYTRIIRTHRRCGGNRPRTKTIHQSFFSYNHTNLIHEHDILLVCGVHMPMPLTAAWQARKSQQRQQHRHENKRRKRNSLIEKYTRSLSYTEAVTQRFSFYSIIQSFLASAYI